MNRPKKYDLYSYYSDGGIYLVLDTDISFGGETVVTLYDMKEKKTIAVFSSVFETTVKEEGKLQYMFSKINVESINSALNYGAKYLSTSTLIKELNSRSGEFLFIESSEVVDSYYDLGIRLPDCEGGFNFIKRKQAENEKDMLKTFLNMKSQSEVSSEFPPSVRKHIVIDVIEPEKDECENEGETDIFTF